VNGEEAERHAVRKGFSSEDFVKTVHTYTKLNILYISKDKGTITLM
jgi:hypothetical protein